MRHVCTFEVLRGLPCVGGSVPSSPGTLELVIALAGFSVWGNKSRYQVFTISRKLKKKKKETLLQQFKMLEILSPSKQKHFLKGNQLLSKHYPRKSIHFIQVC